VIALGGHFDPADLGELPDGVAAALDDDEVRRRCAVAAEELRAAGGAAHAADVIEEVASPGQHPMRR
jgi:UDP:flavonoid glycosyltransferase YjiC (YdhE family)